MMVLKSPKGIYMQLESGKIIAIRTALKVGHNKDKVTQETPFMAREMQKRNQTISSIKAPITTVVSPSSVNTTGPTKTPGTAQTRPRGANHVQFGRNNSVATNKNVQMGTAKPYNLKPNARNVAPSSETSVMMQAQYPMSNSNSSFDADISDDSQFLEKLGENLANQQNNEEDAKQQMNKAKENKCSEPIMQTIPNEQQSIVKNQTNQMMQSHVNKVNNGVGDILPTMVNDKSASMQQSQIQSKPEQSSHPYMNSNPDNYSSMNSANGNNIPTHQNYNYNYNPTNNGNYNDAQSAQGGKPPQQSMQQTSAVSSQQPDKYQSNTQHVNDNF